MASIFLRKKTWWIQYYANSKRIQYSLKVKEKRRAIHLKRVKEIEVEEGITGVSSSTKRVDDFFEEYKRYNITKLKPNSAKAEIQQIRYFLTATSPCLLKNITTKSIQDYLLSLNHGKKTDKTINYYLLSIRNFLRYAKQQGYISVNPAKELKGKNIKYPPPRFLSKEELKIFLPIAIKSPLYPMIATALYAGLRINELMTLQWKDIDFKKMIITVIGKDDKLRVIPLSSHLKTLLAPLASKEGFVFTNNGKGFKWSPHRPLIHIVKKVGLKDVAWHTLRKTFTSHLIMEGVSIAKVSKWLGHESVDLTYERYFHLAPNYDKDIEAIKF